MSVAKIDVINDTTGQPLLTNGYPGRPGRIIEYLTGLCDGSDVIGASGTYTFPSVTAAQVAAATYQTVTGSNIYYCPPLGAKTVTYKFTFSAYWTQAHSINHYAFYVNDTEIVNARHNRSAQYYENRLDFTYTFKIGGTNSPSTGKFTTWDTPKHLYLMFRQYGVSNTGNHHSTTYWDGVASAQFNVPILSIIATA